MSVPPTQIVMLHFPPCELPEFMAALCSALPGSVWRSEVFHQPQCPLTTDTSVADDRCTCRVARLVIVERLQPASATRGNGAGRRTG